MASYALLTALSGFSYSAPAKKLSFAPVLNADEFCCFFSVASGWGVLRRTGNAASVEVLSGELELAEFGAGFDAAGAKATLAGKTVVAKAEDPDVVFKQPVRIAAGERLEVRK
jgi:hypothetical protein